MNFQAPPSSFGPKQLQPDPLLAVACPTCFGAIAVSADLQGESAECPLCGSGFRVPLPYASTQPSPASAPAQRVKRRRKSKPDAQPLTSPADRQPAPDSSSHSVPLGEPPQPAVLADADADTDTDTDTEAEAMRFREPVRTIGSGDRVIELRRLSPEEKASRRGRRNLVMLLSGLSILMVIVLLLGRERR